MSQGVACVAGGRGMATRLDASLGDDGVALVTPFFLATIFAEVGSGWGPPPPPPPPNPQAEPPARPRPREWYPARACPPLEAGRVVVEGGGGGGGGGGRGVGG